MAWSDAEVRSNRQYFEQKLTATKQRSDVLHSVEEGRFEFVLRDIRGREAFAFGHIPGAWCAPLEDLDIIAAQLPADKEIVTYCWGHD